MGDDEIPDRRVGQFGGYDQLDYREKFSGARAEGGEAKDAIVLGDQRFDEASGLGEGEGAKIGEHGDLGETVGDSLLFRLSLRQPDVGKLGVDEGAGWDLAAGGAAVGSGEVVAHRAEVVEGDVGEVRGASTVSHSPDAGEGGFEAVIDLYVAGWGGFDADCLKTHALGVGSAACGDEDVGALKGGFAVGEGEMQRHRFAGGAFDTYEVGVGDHVDAVVVE